MATTALKNAYLAKDLPGIWRGVFFLCGDQDEPAIVVSKITYVGRVKKKTSLVAGGGVLDGWGFDIHSENAPKIFSFYVEEQEAIADRNRLLVAIETFHINLEN
jgi:hypothetical protein